MRHFLRGFSISSCDWSLSCTLVTPSIKKLNQLNRMAWPVRTQQGKCLWSQPKTLLQVCKPYICGRRMAHTTSRKRASQHTLMRQAHSWRITHKDVRHSAYSKNTYVHLGT